MRIEIMASAGRHGITDVEIRAVLAYPKIVVSLDARQDDAVLRMHMGPAAENEPWRVLQVSRTGQALRMRHNENEEDGRNGTTERS